MKNNILLIFISILILSSCDEPIELDLEQTEAVVVIEGLVTNERGNHYVKIGKSSGFDASGGNELISGATVKVRDDNGRSFTYIESSPGYYISEEVFKGEIGSVYTLEVLVEDRLYTASEELRYVSSFDSLTYIIDEEERADPEDPETFYEVLIYIKEPQETEDYYLFKFYKNGEEENYDGQWIYVYDDVAIAENVDALAIDGYFALGDTAKVEVYGLSRSAYRFFYDMNENINSDGGMFNGQPANPNTNLSGGAVGYFQVSAVSSAEIIIE